MRVVSLVPSATEIVLALADRALKHSGTDAIHLIGRSHECDWPPSPALTRARILTRARTTFKSAAQVDADVRAKLASGESLYELDAPALASLRPDLVITQDLCAVCSIDLNSVRAALASLQSGAGVPPAILSLNPTTIDGVFDDILAVGRAVGLERDAVEFTIELRERMFRAAEFVTPLAPRPVVAFLEWTDPLFIGGHWTPQLIERTGGAHPLNPTVAIEGSGAAAGMAGDSMRTAGKSVRVPPEVLIASRPDTVIICPCGLTLSQAEHQARELARSSWWGELLQTHSRAHALRVAVVDGNQMFNRPGPRLVDAFEFLVGLLNDRPEVIPAGFPWRPMSG